GNGALAAAPSREAAPVAPQVVSVTRAAAAHSANAATQLESPVVAAVPVYAPPSEAVPVNGAGHAEESRALALEDRALAQGALRMLPVGSLRPVSSNDNLDIALR